MRSDVVHCLCVNKRHKSGSMRRKNSENRPLIKWKTPKSKIKQFYNIFWLLRSQTYRHKRYVVEVTVAALGLQFLVLHLPITDCHQESSSEPESSADLSGVRDVGGFPPEGSHTRCSLGCLHPHFNCLVLKWKCVLHYHF